MAPNDTQRSASGPARRRQYDEQFKRDAVALLEGGRSATQLARELGISQWDLRDWKRLFGTGGPKAASSPAKAPAAGGAVEQAVELADLRRELAPQVREAFLASRGSYGSPRVMQALLSAGNRPGEVRGVPLYSKESLITRRTMRAALAICRKREARNLGPRSFEKFRQARHGRELGRLSACRPVPMRSKRSDGSIVAPAP
jgi:transposase